MNKGAQGRPVPCERCCELGLCGEPIPACPLWVSLQHSHWRTQCSILPLAGYLARSQALAFRPSFLLNSVPSATTFQDLN